MTSGRGDRIAPPARMPTPQTREPMTIAEVDAMFLAALNPRATKGDRPQSVKPFVARYDRCHGCREITPCLTTFSGDVDSPLMLELEPRLGEYVEHLRATLGRRTILLCSTWCVGLREFAASTPAPETTARLFEL